MAEPRKAAIRCVTDGKRVLLRDCRDLRVRRPAAFKLVIAPVVIIIICNAKMSPALQKQGF